MDDSNSTPTKNNSQSKDNTRKLIQMEPNEVTPVGDGRADVQEQTEEEGGEAAIVSVLTRRREPMTRHPRGGAIAAGAFFTSNAKAVGRHDGEIHSRFSASLWKAKTAKAPLIRTNHPLPHSFPIFTSLSTHPLFVSTLNFHLSRKKKVMAPLIALVHYNGRAIDDDNIENNVPCDGSKPKAMSIKSSFTLEMLKKNIHKKLVLKDNEVVGKMVYRIPHAVEAGKWQLVDVDDGIACLFDMHAVSSGFRTMYLYVETKMGKNFLQTPLAGRTVNIKSSQASAQRHSDNSTPNSMMNPPDQENYLMKDILSDISDHEDDFLFGDEDDEEIEAD
ncbi:hypothetical protein PIB30_101961 [Stylosanthes scabra]|uniref:Uncharacterized protein n=1 Tax=Stylosanthes scabra TaxID=79078 RepID=A0ABU6QX12_9FABA|nr:hypothetical protein [Stylosanthes scabra]